MIAAKRYHDFSAGHRVYGHENKCALPHGHNYRVTFHCAAAQLDKVGRVIDFSVIKTLLCDWLEETWDHKFLLSEEDPALQGMVNLFDADSIVPVPFNPTAENMGRYLLEYIGPMRLAGSGVMLVQVDVEETRKCSATITLE